LYAAARFDGDGRRVRFEVTLMARRYIEGVFEYPIGVAEALLDVAFLPR